MYVVCMCVVDVFSPISAIKPVVVVVVVHTRVILIRAHLMARIIQTIAVPARPDGAVAVEVEVAAAIAEAVRAVITDRTTAILIARRVAAAVVGADAADVVVAAVAQAVVAVAAVDENGRTKLHPLVRSDRLPQPNLHLLRCSSRNSSWRYKSTVCHMFKFRRRHQPRPSRQLFWRQLTDRLELRAVR